MESDTPNHPTDTTRNQAGRSNLPPAQLAPGSAPPTARRIKPDAQVAAIGAPGCGKTVRAKEWALEGARRGEPCVIHDPNDDFEGLGVRYGSLKDFAAAWDTAASKRTGVSPVCRYGGSWEHIVEFFCDETTGFARARQLPTRLVFDEASCTGSSKSLAPPLNLLMSRRRHWWVMPRFNFQFGTQVHFSIVNLSTVLELFRIEDSYSLTELKKRGVPPELVDRLPTLAPLEYVPYVRGLKRA